MRGLPRHPCWKISKHTTPATSSQLLPVCSIELNKLDPGKPRQRTHIPSHLSLTQSMQSGSGVRYVPRYARPVPGNGSVSTIYLLLTAWHFHDFDGVAFDMVTENIKSVQPLVCVPNIES